jgi:hypothetical protein
MAAREDVPRPGFPPNGEEATGQTGPGRTPGPGKHKKRQHSPGRERLPGIHSGRRERGGGGVDSSVDTADLIYSPMGPGSGGYDQAYGVIGGSGGGRDSPGRPPGYEDRTDDGAEAGAHNDGVQTQAMNPAS